MTLSGSVFLRMGNVSDIFVRKTKTHKLCSVKFSPKNLAVYKITWKNMEGPPKPQMAILCMGVACWINKGTDTHSEYIILIAFPRQQCLRERPSILRLYVHYLPCFVLTLHNNRISTSSSTYIRSTL